MELRDEPHDRDLRAGLAERRPDPFRPKSDEVKLDDDKKADAKKDDKKKDDDKKDEAKKAPEPIAIDFDGMRHAGRARPGGRGQLRGLTAVKGYLIYVRRSAPYYGRAPESKPEIKIYDLDRSGRNRRSSPRPGNYAISFDGKKILAQVGHGFALYDAKPESKDKKDISTAGLMVDRVPREEWREVFEEVWRRYRDFFYAKNMNGYDWPALKNRYEPLVDYVAHRSDLNYVIGEMIGELNNGHTYIEGGDWDKPPRAPVGLLGAKITWDAKAGRYRLSKIFHGENEEPRYRSPLDEIGVDVKEGDFLLAVDGEPLKADEDPFALLVDRAQDPITLTIASKDDVKATRDVKVTPIRSEAELLYLDWTQRNRAYVDAKTGGKVGYMQLPDMGSNGAREFIKWFYPQARKNGLIVDDRANGGGNISQWVIDRLSRKLLGLEYGRTAEDPRHVPRSRHARADGLPDQRDQRLGRRHLPVHVPQLRPRAVDRQAHVGRRHRNFGARAADRRWNRVRPAVREHVEGRAPRRRGRGCVPRHRGRQRSRLRDRRQGQPARPRDRGGLEAAREGPARIPAAARGPGQDEIGLCLAALVQFHLRRREKQLIHRDFLEEGQAESCRIW